MVKKPKAQNLRDRIEKSQNVDFIDPDLQSHYQQILSSLSTIGPLAPFSLLSPEGAQAAAQQFNLQLEKLSHIGKQIKAVSTLMKDQKAREQLSIESLPWPESQRLEDSKFSSNPKFKLRNKG